MRENYKISPQQNSEKRIILKDAIPLKTPLSLQIELASACNFKCKFCMHGNPNLIKQEVYKIGIMKLSLFKKVVDDLKQFSSPIKFISLQCRGESLLNPDICDMVKYLKDACVTNEIVLNTNASLLTNKLSLKLVAAGLDTLRVSVEGVNEEQYKKISGVDIDFRKLVEDVEFFYKNRKQCYVYTKIIDCDMTEEDKEIFLSTFGDISDGIFIEKPIDIWKDAGLDKDIFKYNRWNTDVEKVEICPRIFFAYAVHFDGTVVSCDQDWKEETIIGNAEIENMAELWNGSKLNEIRRNHLNRQSDVYDRCRDCEIRKECLLKDNIDNIDETVIEYFNN